MNIPHTLLAPATLRALIEDFITREGTDYGQTEYSLDSKIAQVTAQLANGKATITFDPESETTGIHLVAPLSAPVQTYELD